MGGGLERLELLVLGAAVQRCASKYCLRPFLRMERIEDISCVCVCVLVQWLFLFPGRISYSWHVIGRI